MAGDPVSRDAGVREPREAALRDETVAVTDAAGVDDDADLAGGRFGDCAVGEFEVGSRHLSSPPETGTWASRPSQRTMRRRSVLRALLGTATVSALSGCSGLFDRVAGRQSTATTRPEGSADPAEPAAIGSTPATSPTPRPYRAAGRPALDRPRGIHVRNLGSADRFLTVVVSDGEETAFVDSTDVGANGSVAFPALLATAGRYEVLVETADGARRRYDWAVRADLDDLWVDLTPEVSFHRPVLCLDDCPFTAAGTERTLAYTVPPGVGVAEALGGTPAVAVDNDTGGETRATVHVWNQGELRFASSYDLPADVRVVVPVLPASRRYDLVLRTDDGEAIYDWQPSVRTTLYASLAGGPAFRCGYASHDLRVRNETDTAREVTVRVLTNEGTETLFEGSFDLGANEVERVASAVEPAGPFRFEVETRGTTVRYNWVRCAPNGPITVAVSDRGVHVSVTPVRGSG